MLWMVLGISIIAVAIGAWISTPAKLAPTPPSAVIPGAVDDYLRAREAAAEKEFGLVPGAQKRVLWAVAPGQRSEYALVYLHGFSATRQEIAPVPELVAEALGANLFETRLAGHGRETEKLTHISAEQWMQDGAEALAIAKTLGDKIILMGTSTGATLALAMARHPDYALVNSLVLLAPNFGPAGRGTGITTGPYGPQLTRLILGERRSWVPANPLQAKYWSTDYPTASLVEMMRLVDLAQTLTKEASTAKAMLVYSPKDDVVSVSKLVAGFDALPAQRKQVLRVDEPDSLSPHVFTGDILAPGTSSDIAAKISAFIAES